MPTVPASPATPPGVVAPPLSALAAPPATAGAAVLAPGPAVQRAASAYGGVVVLVQAWAAFEAAALATAGVRWQGQGRAVLLRAVVLLPVLAVDSVQALATLAGTVADPLWRALGWGAVLTQRRLARFVTSPRHDWWGVLTAVATVLARAAPTGLGPACALAVDSTTVEKRYGPRLAGRHPVYDAVQKKLVDGYALVSATAVGAQTAWPLGLVPHRPLPPRTRRRRPARPDEAPSKLDLALRFVQVAVATGVLGGGGTVLGDSAFCVMWWLQEVATLGCAWLVATRQDRRLRIGAAIQPVRDWCAAVPLTLVTATAAVPTTGPPPRPTRRRPRPAGTTVWGACLPQGVLLERHCTRRGLPCQAAYFERRAADGTVRHRWYLVTSHLDWDLPTIWGQWQRRWAIEVLHRTSKQWLHLGSFHSRTWEGIVTWVVCAGLRATLLAVLRTTAPAWGACSTEALVARLRQAACTVVTAPTGTLEVQPPATLPAPALWAPTATPDPPVPPEWWPVVLRAA